MAVSVTDGPQSRRIFLFLLRENLVRREPAIEAGILQRAQRVGSDTGKENRYAVFGLIAQKMFEPLDTHDVRIACAFQAEDHELDVLRVNALLQRLQITV